GSSGDRRRDHSRHRDGGRARPATGDRGCRDRRRGGRRGGDRGQGPRAGPAVRRPHDPVRRPRGRARGAGGADQPEAMIPLSTVEIAAATGGTTDVAIQVTGIATDSREVSAGDLFVALPGTRADGGEFVDAALAAGAAAAVVPRVSAGTR